MALKMEVTCSRCNKTHLRTVENSTEADAFAALEKKKKDRLVEIAAFFETIPPQELPDFMVISGGDSSVVHANLCDPKEDEGKRSCLKRVRELLQETAALQPRKPRTVKPKAGESATAPAGEASAEPETKSEA